MLSRIEAVNRRRSDRAIAGPPMHTWYCSVFLCWNEMLAAGGATSGGRARGFRAGGGAFFAAIRWHMSTSRSWSTFPAAATTRLSPTYLAR